MTRDAEQPGCADSMRHLREEMEACCRRIHRVVRVMEVCGTHTVSIFRSGIRAILPSNLVLLSGPGCPVCVTAQRHIDAAIELTARPGVTITTYGDMLRVPGRLGSLESRRAAGADVRVVNSARSALSIARTEPDRSVVFLGVGFETTAPATAAVVMEADRDGIENFSVLLAHKLVVPAMQALLESGEVRIDGFLCPGHVSVITGAESYRVIAEKYRRPCVVAGFEPIQIMRGLVHLLRQIEKGESRLENVYAAVVSQTGNPVAQRVLRQVFIAAATPWRELGEIPDSGLDFVPRFRRFDALRHFNLQPGEDIDNPACICGKVICGMAEPSECPLFGRGCTPLTPIGPCMVSGEGTCAAWFKYGMIAEEARV